MELPAFQAGGAGSIPLTRSFHRGFSVDHMTRGHDGLPASAFGGAKDEPKPDVGRHRTHLWLIHEVWTRRNPWQVRVRDDRGSGSIGGRGCRDDQTLVGRGLDRDRAARRHGRRSPGPGETTDELVEGRSGVPIRVASGAPSGCRDDRVSQRRRTSGARSGESRIRLVRFGALT
jgi:hypothetical protein